jgi:DNA-binding response OmpR family regulator
MDGKACLGAIKQQEKLKQIPVIMYSTSSNLSEIRHYEQMGARFLVKPNKFRQLVTSLSGILGYAR